MIPKYNSSIPIRLFVLTFVFTLFSLAASSFAQQEREDSNIEICDKSSTITIATDGGSLNISSLQTSSVASFSNDEGASGVVEGLIATCGYESVVTLEGNSLSIAGVQIREQYSKLNASKDSKLSLDAVISEMCNYDAVVVEVINQDSCNTAKTTSLINVNGYPFVGLNGYPFVDQNGSPWVDQNGSPWVDVNGSPWVDGRGSPWVDQKGSPWVDVNGSPWVDLNGSPWVDLNGSPWVDLRGEVGTIRIIGLSKTDDQVDGLKLDAFPFTSLNGYPFVGLNGYPFVDQNGSPWVDINGSPWVDVNGSPWVHVNGSPWVDQNGYPFVD